MATVDRLPPTPTLVRCVGAALVVLAGACSGAVERTGPSVLNPAPFARAPSSRVVDKVDILFDIDNSRSMGDKQDYLKAAIPDLINRLINPNCVDNAGTSYGPSIAGVCTSAAWQPEFTPVHDLHLGIISSSLGKRGGDVCDPAAMAQPPFEDVLANNDDQAHLLNRSLTYYANSSAVTQGVVADASGQDPYLYWFPPGPNMGKTPSPGTIVTNGPTLIQDFTDLVGGVGVFGCGIESQLESWYRFLIQPDPYQTISTKGGPAQGVWNGVDSTILAQRHDFLRPDSAVLIVDLSDENDSEIDVRSIGGLGVNWMTAGFNPPKGTSACATNPASSACLSCAQGSNGAADSNCTNGPYSAQNDWGMDINLRHVHMKARYGVDPQYPIERYVTGLASTVVPDRIGEYPNGAASYQGMLDCQNPLFAGVLPTGSDLSANALCHTPPGPRTKDLVFYAHIGGVPHQLLHFTPGNATASTLSASDWVKILGNDPENYDYSGIDPHMIESFQPRPGLAQAGSANGTDPVNGHEWITDTSNGQPGFGSPTGHVLAVDLEYACIFPLSDSTGSPKPRDCTQPQNADFCDCPHTAGSVTAQELPPICDQTTITKQTGAKAYPTIRELLLANKMGKQGIVSSICPIDVADNATGDDPLYGYRPAVSVIVDRLKNALSNLCLPQQLTVQRDGTVGCSILLQVPAGAAGTSGTCRDPQCPRSAGLEVPSSQLLQSFCADLESIYQGDLASSGGAGGLTDPANVPVCQLVQLSPAANPADFAAGNCAAGVDKGWCYVTGAAAGRCPQAIVFTAGAIPPRAISNLQCGAASVDGG